MVEPVLSSNRASKLVRQIMMLMMLMMLLMMMLIRVWIMLLQVDTEEEGGWWLEIIEALIKKGEVALHLLSDQW